MKNHSQYNWFVRMVQFTAMIGNKPQKVKHPEISFQGIIRMLLATGGPWLSSFFGLFPTCAVVTMEDNYLLYRLCDSRKTF